MSQIPQESPDLQLWSTTCWLPGRKTGALPLKQLVPFGELLGGLQVKGNEPIPVRASDLLGCEEGLSNDDKWEAFIFEIRPDSNPFN